MGYWDIHPMGGDYPCDVQGEITDLLFTEDELDEDLDGDEKEYAKRLKARIEEVINLDLDLSFVIPFTFVEYKVRISDKALSDKVKEMIEDGGAGERDYDEHPSNQENGYNGFKSPWDYACQLRDSWDDLMSGKKDFDELQREVGLFEHIFALDRKPGLINKK